MNRIQAYDHDSNSDDGALPARHRRPHAKTERKLTCYLTPVLPGRALSLALARYLTDEMPDIAFTLEEHERVDAIWVCGYDRRAARHVRKLRTRHPTALIVVSGRSPATTWKRDVIESGADLACSWPLDYACMNRILHGVHVTDDLLPPRDPHARDPHDD